MHINVLTFSKQTLANTSHGRVGRGGNAYFYTFKLDDP